jgi:hypothetical protein
MARQPPREFGTHWNLFALHSVAIRTRSEATGTRLEATGTRLPPLVKSQLCANKHLIVFRPSNLRLFRFSPVKFCIETLLRAASFAPPVAFSVSSSLIVFLFFLSSSPSWRLCLSVPHRPVGRSSGSRLEVGTFVREETANVQLPTLYGSPVRVRRDEDSKLPTSNNVTSGRYKRPP